MGLFSSSKSSSETTIKTTDQRIAADEGSIVAGNRAVLTINATDREAVDKALSFSKDAFNESLAFAREAATPDEDNLAEKALTLAVPVAVAGVVLIAVFAFRSR